MAFEAPDVFSAGPQKAAPMPEIHLFFDPDCAGLYPFHLIEGVEGIRQGAFTQRERWSRVEKQLGDRGWIAPLHVNARWIPDDHTVDGLMRLGERGELRHGRDRLAFHASTEDDVTLSPIEVEHAPRLLRHGNDLFTGLEHQLLADVDTLRELWGLTEFSTNPPTHAFGPADRILVSSDAIVRASTLDSSGGAIVIGPGAQIEPGSHIQGPVIIHEGAVVRTGTHIRGATVIGPHCKVGGEISNVNFQGWANKAHGGFIGNSVIGRWCNLGAGTESSNLKNTYGTVRQWSEQEQRMVDTGLQFCGVLMGDHSKCGIGTTLNTGTIMGPASVVFDAGFPPKHLPPFSWHDARTRSTEPHDLGKMLSTARTVMARRGMTLSDGAKANLSALHNNRHG